MKKGFTLIELAIALMVIGLIIGMAMEGASLVFNAQVKAAIAKVNKIETAMLSYLSKYNRFPGEQDVANRKFLMADAYSDLIDEGLLTAGDFELELDGSGVYLRIVGCQYISDTATARQVRPFYNMDNVCIITTTADPATDVSDGFYTVGVGSTKFACYVEKLLDDGSMETGNGTSSVDSWTMPEDCDDASIVYQYTYTIF